jgi:hypothetical protein
MAVFIRRLQFMSGAAEGVEKSIARLGLNARRAALDMSLN